MFTSFSKNALYDRENPVSLFKNNQSSKSYSRRVARLHDLHNDRERYNRYWASFLLSLQMVPLEDIPRKSEFPTTLYHSTKWSCPYVYKRRVWLYEVPGVAAYVLV